MADVTKIPGPLPQEPSKSREPAKPGTDKFKDLMKVGKSGEEQKKQKKRQEEAEEENKAKMRTGAVRPERPAEGVKKVQKFPKIQKVGESEKRQPQQQKRAEEAAAADEVAAATAAGEKIKALDLSKVEPSLEKGATPPPSYAGAAAAEEEIKEVVEEEKKAEATSQAFVKREVKKEKSIEQPPVQPAATTLGPLFIAPPTQTAPAYTLLSPEMLAIFERMVSQIFIMQANGVNETTIHLNTPEFASSRFAGAQIIIREFSTAPLSFNIEFLGTAQNALLFEQNIASLRAAFASEQRNYTINRIESRLLREEKPLFHRKERPSKKEEEES